MHKIIQTDRVVTLEGGQKQKNTQQPNPVELKLVLEKRIWLPPKFGETLFGGQSKAILQNITVLFALSTLNGGGGGGGGGGERETIIIRFAVL